MPQCQRCNKETNTYTYSWYNDQRICCACRKSETERKDYADCRKAELEALRKGNYNYIYKKDI